jgi:ADP-ribosyl-[dinitrogen reductase] hydrolase
VAAWRRKPHRWRMPGLYTDDTQQALALCYVLLECRHIDQELLADVYLGLMTPKGPFSGAHRGIGRSFRHVLACLEPGVPPNLAGQATAGIGAAMRIAPVALYFGDETERMFDSVMAASLMTHRDIRSLSGALAVAHGVRRLAAGEPREPSLLFRVAADLMKDEARIAADFGVQVLKFDRHAGGLSRAIAHVEGLLDLPSDHALASLVTEANRHGADPICRRATMGFPPACIPTCFYVLMTTDSFEEALTEIVNLGGDTDTSAAILGALAGAYYGVDAIAERWLDGLQNREGIDAWAIALAHRSRRGIHIPDLISTERRLTQKEGENFDAFASVTRTADEEPGGDADHIL